MILEENLLQEGTQNDKYSLSQTFYLIVFKVTVEDNEMQWSIYELILKKNKISYKTRTDLQPDQISEWENELSKMKQLEKGKKS